MHANVQRQILLEGRPPGLVAPSRRSSHPRHVLAVSALPHENGRPFSRTPSQSVKAVKVEVAPAERDAYSYEILVSEDPEELAHAIAQLQLENKRMREELQVAVKALESVSPEASVQWAREAAFHLEGLTADDLAQGLGTIAFAADDRWRLACLC
jgi:hypothetical protein